MPHEDCEFLARLIQSMSPMIWFCNKCAWIGVVCEECVRALHGQCKQRAKTGCCCTALVEAP